MTGRALFRFTGNDKIQYACVNDGDAWIAVDQAEFLCEHDPNIALHIWNSVHYLPQPMGDFPELEALLVKVRDYVNRERVAQDEIVALKQKGALADEIELLSRVAGIYGRLRSMYLACVTKYLSVRSTTDTAVA